MVHACYCDIQHSFRSLSYYCCSRKAGSSLVDSYNNCLKQKDVLGNKSAMVSSCEPRHGKTNILHTCVNKDADQLRGNREADQRLCFRYIDCTIPLLFNPKFHASSHFLQLYSLIYDGPGPKPECWFSHDAAHVYVPLSH